VIGTHPCAESCASLGLKLSSQEDLSSQFSVPSSPFSVLGSPFSVNAPSSPNNHDEREKDRAEEKPSHAELLTGIEIRAEVLRSRNERKPVQSTSAFITKTAWTA
jgi:hypothetical protein